MLRQYRRSRWLAGLSTVVLAFGGCVTSQQYLDFGRTELARVISDLVGRAYLLYLQGTV